MNMRMKKILTLLTAGVLMSASLPAGAMAANTADTAAAAETAADAAQQADSKDTSGGNTDIPADTNDVQYAEVAVKAGSKLTYTGQKLKPEVTVTLLGKTLVRGTDYKVTYAKNINAGTATLKVTGKGAYTGSIKKHFTIKKAKQALDLKNSYKYSRYVLSFSLAQNNLAEGTTVTYKSADKSVAKVKADGTVIPKGYGRTTIKVTAKNPNYKTVTKTVKVTFIPERMVMTSLTSPETKKITIGFEADDEVEKYQIQISYRKDFEDTIIDETKDAIDESGKYINSIWWKNYKRMKSGTRYYARIRSIITVNDVECRSQWSKVRSVYLR